MPTLHQALSALAMVITVATFLPYIRGIHARRIRPHAFTWVVWGLTTVIVAVAQLGAGGGAGAWAIALSGVITLYVTALALAGWGDRVITRTDWAFLLAALGSLPAWFLTSDPLWAVLILTLVDTLGCGPTLRKAWSDPHHESALFFAWFVLRNALVVAALDEWSVTTLAFPVVVGATCAAIVAIIVARRRVVERIP